MPSPKQLLEVIGIQTEIAKLGLDLGEVMALVVERTLGLIGADGAAIELAEGNEMVYRAASGIARPQIGLRLALNASLSGCCVRTGEILRCDDSEEDPRVDRNACRAVGLRSMIVIPLRHHDATVGVLKAMSSQPAKFSAQDEALLGLLSEAVAAAMFFATKYGQDDLFHMATHDSLTGLANRALFMDRLRNTLIRCSRDRQPVGVLMIDMDGLKRINDDFGHRAGDAAIREFGTRIARATRSSDTVARLGGDEFAIILSPVDNQDGIDTALHRLQEATREPFRFEGREHPLTASVGAASYPDDSADVLALIDVADQRMYRTKRESRQRHASTALH